MKISKRIVFGEGAFVPIVEKGKDIEEISEPFTVSVLYAQTSYKMI